MISLVICFHEVIKKRLMFYFQNGIICDLHDLTCNNYNNHGRHFHAMRCFPSEFSLIISQFSSRRHRQTRCHPNRTHKACTVVNDIGVAFMKFYNLHSDATALDSHNQSPTEIHCELSHSEIAHG